jgi:hypothetical protein
MCGCKANNESRYTGKKQPKGVYKRKTTQKPVFTQHSGKITYNTKYNYV